MNWENTIKPFLTGESCTTLFVTLDDDACYFVPASSPVSRTVVDELIKNKGRFSVYLFNRFDAPYPYPYANNAYVRIMRTVYDGPVVTEEWDYRDHEWIPS